MTDNTEETDAISEKDRASRLRGQARDAEAPFWPHAGPLLFLTLIFFINFVSRIILSPLLPTIERDLGLSHSQAGFLFFLISTGYLVGLMGSGFFSSRLNHSTTIILSSAGVGVALLSVSLMRGLWGIHLGLIVLGVAAGAYIPSAIATITALIESRHWGKAFAIHELAPNLAFLSAPFFAALLLRWSSWRAALSLFGVASLLAGVAFARYGKGGDFRSMSSASGSVRSLLRRPSFWLMLWLFGLGVGSTIGIFAMLPLYLVSEREMDQTWANTLVALSRVSGPFMIFLGGWATDKLGAAKTMAASLLVSGATTLLLGPVSISWVIVFIFFQAALAGCFFPPAFAALAAISPADSRNTAVAFAVPFGYILGAGATPTFIGIMGDAGSFALGFTLVGALIFAGGAAAFYLKLPDQR